MQVVKLKHFQKFENTTDALAAASALVDSKLSKGLYFLGVNNVCSWQIEAVAKAHGPVQIQRV